jgi:hypothetical protein
VAREGVHAAFSGIEGKKDVAGPAFTRSTEANFQEMTANSRRVSLATNGEGQFWTLPACHSSSEELDQPNDLVPLFQTHNGVVASIEAASPGTDDVIAASRAEAHHALLDCELEKKGEDPFFGCIPESDRTARCDVMLKRCRRTDFLADRQIEHGKSSSLCPSTWRLPTARQ